MLESRIKKTVHKMESSTQCKTFSCENSTQYEILTRSVSSQSDCVLAFLKKSTASQTEAVLPSSSTSTTERDVSKRAFSPEPLSELLCNGWRNSDSCACSWPDEKLLPDIIFTCHCTLKHKYVSNCYFTICSGAELHVSQRNPLVIGRSSLLFVCPFKFWVEAELVNHKYKRDEKMFKVIVSCENANKNRGDPPASTFRYALILVNHNENGVVKTYKGT